MQLDRQPLGRCASPSPLLVLAITVNSPRKATGYFFLLATLCLLSVGACQSTSNDQSDEVLLLSGSLSDTIQRLKHSVVRISVGGRGGTGVIVKGEGTTATIVTNAHVITDPDAVRVKVNDSATYDAKVLGLDNSRDLAFLSICCASS